VKDLHLTKVPVADTAMLIRRPIAEVFEAFADPAVTTQFWFSKGSGRLEAGKQVQWEWEMYDFSVSIDVKVVEANQRIVIQWPGANGLTEVEWTFTELEQGTFVRVVNSGFTGTGDEVVAQALDSNGGFCWVLAGCKALLEHNIKLNLVPDRFPEGLATY